MRHVTVVIAMRSRILSLGLKAAMDESAITNVSIHIVDPGLLLETLDKMHPSILVTDALTMLAYSDRELRIRMSDSGAVLGMLDSALPQDIIKSFDGCFSVYDSLSMVEKFVMKTSMEPAADDRQSELTPREREVLIGIVKGQSNKEIASAMNVSVNTIMTHRRNIANKLQIHSAAGLTIYAIVSKLVTIDEIRTAID
ncbi:MAG: LuxR C-terminal-related transcriptional regulator [Muribaculaceae bacterium]|nr:LuxR C-terminal-related transcriptional regulator [Muribaculaceae bacterium]